MSGKGMKPIPADESEQIIARLRPLAEQHLSTLPPTSQMKKGKSGEGEGGDAVRFRPAGPARVHNLSVKIQVSLAEQLYDYARKHGMTKVEAVEAAFSTLLASERNDSSPQ